MNKKKGIAISLYDKFEDLAILVDIIKENWEDDYYIAVCCSHDNGESIIKDELNLDIDKYTETEIKYSPEMNKEDQRGRINLQSRIANQFQKSLSEVIENTEYAMHLHADAWPLEEEKIDEIIMAMKNRDKKVAVRGKGLGYRRSNWRLGHFMDQFIIFDSKYAKEKKFMDFNPLNLLPDAGIHQILSIILLGRVGLDNLLLYSTEEKDEFWDGKSSKLYGVRPSMYNPEWGIMHVARENFPKDLGKEVQAMYLRKHNISKGEYINKLLNKESEMNEEELLKELNSLEKSLDRRLRLLFYRQGDLTRKFNQKQEILDKPLKQKIKIACKNFARELYHETNNMLFKIGLIKNGRYNGPRQSRYAYRDSEWPAKEYTEKYQSLRKRDFPEQDKFWFDNFKIEK